MHLPRLHKCFFSFFLLMAYGPIAGPLCQPPRSPSNSLPATLLQLSVCAQFISFAAELFPTAANNPGRVWHPLCPCIPCTRVARQRVGPSEQWGQLGYRVAPVAPSFVAACRRRYCWPWPTHTFPLNLLSGSCCARRPRRSDNSNGCIMHMAQGVLPLSLPLLVCQRQQQ